MASRAHSTGIALGLALLIGEALAMPAWAQTHDDPRTMSRFLQGLRERGYYDLAGDYLDQLRSDKSAPIELLEVIDFELGRMLLDEAAKTNDLVRRKDLLDQARTRLESFTKNHPTNPKTPEALVQLARLLIERGSLAMLQVDDTAVASEKEAKRSEARSFFTQAGTAYETAEKGVSAAYEKFPRYLDDNDPRKAERDRVHTALMESQLQKAVVDYELGQTYPLDSKERIDFMTKALAQFESLYKRYRTQFAGLTARMWQAKCYEERGDLGPALGIYNELLEHADPRLRPLQRHVGYFRIIALGKRKQFALAADEAVRWLQANNAPELLRQKEGLGVQLELAKNLVAQLPEASGETERNAAVKRVIDTLGGVVRYSSPFKAEALELLKKYKPSAAANATEVSRLNYEDAVSQGEQALAAHEWDRAALLLKHAIRRAEALRDQDKTNYARYNLAFVYYMDKRYYPAAVIAEHIARRYPRNGLAAKAAEIGMASLAEAYNAYTEIDRTSDLLHLVELARYTAATFPEQDQGDTARMTLGQIEHGTGHYPEAIAAYESVRPKSSQWVEARTRAGASHWKQSLVLRNQGKAAEADKETARALEVLNEALKTRREQGATPSDAGLIGNACDIADILLETGKAAEALKLLEPIAKAQTNTSGPALTRLTSTLLRTHISTNQVDLALADMAALEKTGGGTNLTQLYFGLGKLLQSEMDALKKKGDSAGLSRTQQSYFKFLSALAASKSGQTFESLQWAGENMLAIGNAREAEGVFLRILETFGKEAAASSPGQPPDRLFRTRLKLSAAYRAQGKFAESEKLVSDLTTQFPNAIEPLMEKGMLAEDRAAAKKGPWNVAFNQWRTIALRLAAPRTRPLEYYDAWYHAALALSKEGKVKEAKQTLASVMRLSRSVGGPEMKEKYETLLSQLK
ncbi:MAG: tetratricopeptide repeat protein [Isosphaeraceae bacterium]